MAIKQLFAEDINRPINGVVQVEQKDETTEREVKEYVVTSELKKYFLEFFNSYGDSFSSPTSDIGVWISGFFGSGKSHFLKMLSYILENQEITRQYEASVTHRGGDNASTPHSAGYSRH